MAFQRVFEILLVIATSLLLVGGLFCKRRVRNILIFLAGLCFFVVMPLLALIWPR